MPATVSIHELNGPAPGTATAITTLYFQTTDSPTQDLTKPLVKPDSGSNYSYWKSIYLNADTSPDNRIDNVKFYSDGSIDWPGCTLWVADETPDLSSYAQATGTEGVTGDEMTANHPAVTSKTDMATYTQSSPKSIPGSIDNPNTGPITSLVILQVEVTDAASAGDLPTEVLTFQYDEV